jgi:hypothetical protein
LIKLSDKDFYFLHFISSNILVNKDLFFEMAFKSPSSILFVDQTEFRRQKKNTSKQSFCRVCDGEARYIHYGSLVCSSCKTFFRRYASYTKVLNFYLNYSIDIYIFFLCLI